MNWLCRGSPAPPRPRGPLPNARHQHGRLSRWKENGPGASPCRAVPSASWALAPRTATGLGIAWPPWERGQELCAHLALPVTAIAASHADGSFQARIKMPLKQSNEQGYLYFWFSMAPLLTMHPMAGMEQPWALQGMAPRGQREAAHRGSASSQGCLPCQIENAAHLPATKAKAQSDAVLARLLRPQAVGMPSVPV